MEDQDSIPLYLVYSFWIRGATEQVGPNMLFSKKGNKERRVVMASAAVFMLFVVNGIHAAPIIHPYTQDYEKCMSGPDSYNTLAQYMCIEDEHKKWDKRLNDAYKKVLSSRMNAPAWKIAQRKWLQFRDAQCGIYNFKERGSGGGVDQAICELNLTIDRALQLEDDSWPS
ncbi:TPA: lysozyme inhibitor LprI family protein [Pseudomonas aeruginosa]|uniref:lysozyme inhibitor LprI family protein n=1 Tax=Pseudomonas aeruginosa TaxID=287 RepID=UPI0028DD3D80|nr:lysozyme inhibitor LprI family protein [Pseudomonas aeruginosa]WNP71065.1 lysozyme inhibitor LprI family protein [Pseudomonas aeruginosa]HBN9524507.1 DUF1311 domain-containing protein [Pseudomonas aeruginosa]HBO4788425.1 DUF1311 domain-containing protein [Pseudomonas aeruginosa]